MSFDYVFHPFVMLWCGQGLHFLKILRDYEMSGKPIGPIDWLRKHPYAAMFSVVAGFVVYGFLYTSNQLTHAGAFTAGYMADSLINAFTKREHDKVEANQQEVSK
jgi:hypothetical protein